MRTAARNVALFALLLLALAARPAAQAGAIVISIVRPSSGGFVDTRARVEVLTSSANPVAFVTATIAGRSAVLPRLAAGHFAGAVDLTGVRRGPQTLTVTAADTAGHRSTLSEPVVLDALPRVRLVSPLVNDVVTDSVHLVVTCVDDFPASCQSVQAYINGAPVAQGVSSIDETIPIAALTGFSKAQPFVTIVARDSSGQAVLTSGVSFFVETSDTLVRVSTAPGSIIDTDSERLLFNNGTTALRYRNNGRIQPILVAGAEINDVLARLIPGGVLARETTFGPRLYEWRDETATELGFVDSLGVVVNQTFAAWRGHDADSPSTGSVLFLRDLAHRTTIRVDDGLALGARFGLDDTEGFDVSSEGVVTYWKPLGSGAAIWQYQNGVTTQRTGNPPMLDTAPQGYGSLLAFRRVDPMTGTAALIVKVNQAERTLTTWPNTQPPSGYTVRDGFLPYEVPGPSGTRSLWVRAPIGTVSQVSANDSGNFVIAAGPAGIVLFSHSGVDPLGDLMESQPGRPVRRIATDLARPVWISGQLHVMLGRALFRVLPPPTPRPVVWIDIPAGGATAQPFRVAGWALDTAATTGTGVDIVQIYAMPDVGPAIFLGTATYGGTRPDVGTAFGSHFTNSGYGLVASGLPAGHYQIAVFAHDAVLGGFAPAALREVTVP